MDRNRSDCLIMMNNTREDKLMTEMTFPGVCSVNRHLKIEETLLSVNRRHPACFTIMYKTGGRGFRVRGKMYSCRGYVEKLTPISPMEYERNVGCSLQ